MNKILRVISVLISTILYTFFLLGVVIGLKLLFSLNFIAWCGLFVLILIFFGYYGLIEKSNIEDIEDYDE